MTQRRVPVWLLAVVALLAIGWYLAGGSLDIGADAGPSSVSAADDFRQRYSDLDIVTIDALPPEAHDTLALIVSGGPFPYSRDDMVFQNRERLLPLRDNGHYREYTVITAGEDDRGARRIVAGSDGGLYYTDDHYSSFREIVGAEG